MQRRDIAGRVNARLEAAYVAARELIQNHRSEVEKLANLLSVTSTLERPELAEAVRKIWRHPGTLGILVPAFFRRRGLQPALAGNRWNRFHSSVSAAFIATTQARPLWGIDPTVSPHPLLLHPLPITAVDTNERLHRTTPNSL